MDDSIKYKDTPPIAEENWMNYFQCLHSISSVCILIRTQEDILMQSQPLHYFITLLPVHHKLFNPFAPEPPVTARADPGPFYPL